MSRSPYTLRSPYAVILLVSLVGCGDVVSGSGQRSAAPGAGIVRAASFQRPPLAAAAGTAAVSPSPDAVADPGAAEAAFATAVDEPMRSEPVGHLEQPHTLRHLYQALALLEDGHAHEDVRILQYGDSHTAADFGTGEMRRELQARFGDGGRGFVALGRPWPKWPYTQDGVHTGATPEWKSARTRGTGTGGGTGAAAAARDAQHRPDGCYGLLGAASETDKGGRAWTDSALPASKIEVSYFEQPGGGSFDLLIDHAKVAHIETAADAKRSAWRTFDVSDGPHVVEAEAAADGDVRLFGLTLDRASAGIQVDALGVNGAQIYGPLAWNEAHWAEQLRHRAPDLVVLAYGTNESMESTPAEQYEVKLAELVGRVLRAVPAASCMLLGPIDRAAKQKNGTWESAPKVAEIVASQRRVAAAAGCAFYDQQAAMGGAGAIDQWAQATPPRARGDHVHLTRPGYEQLARALVGDSTAAYGVWRADNGLSPSSPPPVAAQAPPPPAAIVHAEPAAPHHRHHSARR